MGKMALWPCATRLGVEPALTGRLPALELPLLDAELGGLLAYSPPRGTPLNGLMACEEKGLRPDWIEPLDGVGVDSSLALRGEAA